MMSKKNKGTKNINDAGNMKNDQSAQSETHMENSNKKNQGAQSCNNKNCK
jgi:hypothetical protein